MKNVFVVCLLLLLGETLIAQSPLKFGTQREPEVPGYAGLASGVKLYKVNGRYKLNYAQLPYARVCVIDGKDTVRLTCDAIGTYFWETNKISDTLEFQLTAAGFPTYTKKYPARSENRNWVNLTVVIDSTRVLNEVIISDDKVEVTIQNDTITYPVENTFKTLEGDFVGDFLRGLPGFAMENGFLTLNGHLIHRVHLNIESANKKSIRISNIMRAVEMAKEVRKQEKLKRKK